MLAYMEVEVRVAENEDIVLLTGFTTKAKYSYKKYEAELEREANTLFKGILRDVFTEASYGKHYLKVSALSVSYTESKEIPHIVDIRKEEDGVPEPKVYMKKLTLYEKDGVYFQREYGMRTDDPDDTLELVKRKIKEYGGDYYSQTETQIPDIYYICKGHYYKSCGLSLD